MSSNTRTNRENDSAVAAADEIGGGHEPNSPQGRLKQVLMRQDVILLGVLIAMVAFFTSMNPLFLSTNSLANVLQDWAPVMLLAIGQTYVIITAGIDLSVGSTLGLAGVSGALIIRQLHESAVDPTVAIMLGLLTALVVGATVGLINGLLITRVKLAPFIATLATMGAGAGAILVLTKGVQIAGGPREVVTLGTTRVLGVLTIPLLIVIVILVIAWLVLEQTRFGRWNYAIGSNSFAARAAGINVDLHLIKVYMLSGLMAGFAGMFLYLRLGSGSPTSGSGYELTAIAAVVIGGTSLFGGSGKMSGTVLGAFITTSVLSGLILIGVGPYWQQVVVGVLIAIAVGMQQVGAGKLKRGATSA